MRHHGRRSPGSFAPRVSAVALLVAGALVAASCGKGQDAAPSAPSKDFKAAAKASIDETNMDSELQKLKAEVDADSE